MSEIKRFSISLRMSEKQAKKLNSFVDGTIFRSRNHLIEFILTDWIENTAPNDKEAIAARKHVLKFTKKDGE